MSKQADDVIGEDGKVRVLSLCCSTCVFRPGDLMNLGEERFRYVVQRNFDAGALLTCHQTLPYGAHPDFGPAVCAGFWAKHGMETTAGIFAQCMIGITKIPPPDKGTA